MITDNNLVLDAANASIRGANTYVSTNTLDLSVARDIGKGGDLQLFFNVDVAFSGGTQVTIQVITSASADLSTPTVRSQSAAILTAALVINAVFSMRVPRILNDKGARYFGVQYVSTGTYTVGSISCRMVLDVSDVVYYASGFTIV